MSAEEIIELRDAAIGLDGLIVLDSTRRGPAFGGIRRKAYASADALRADGHALAEAMTLKCALAGLPAGGGKTVLAAVPGADVDRIYDAVGDAVQRLGGRYVCGPDIGTGPAELDRVRAKTRWINPEGNDAGASTAAGVLAGLRAVWRCLGIGPAGSSAAIQGLGSVGRSLAASLRGLGVRVLGTDLDRARVDAADVEPLDADAVLDAEVDVFVPCAAGGVLTVDAVSRLRCRAVCGSANNQLADDAAAGALVERGILHAPDIIVSAGAVTEGVLTIAEGTGEMVRARVAAAIAALETVTYEVLVVARDEGRAPDTVARDRARALVVG